ncbi:MAG: hypothetical protein KGI66_04650 [Patescibacteria group bacterium]|nr:hypothetical protein [Patescibacteria group bacterium]
MIKWIVIFILILLLLAYFGLNLRSLVSSPTFQDNWGFLSNLAVTVWDNYLKGPLSYLWNDVIYPILDKQLLSKMPPVPSPAATSTSAGPGSATRSSGSPTSQEPFLI